MKLAFICAGDIQIPPPSWGAVEILVWDYYNNLKKMGVDVHIYNTKNLNWIKSEIKSKKFDFIHLQHEDLLPYLEDLKSEKFAVTSHCGWADNIKYYEPYYWKTVKSVINGPHNIFTLSENIKNNYINLGFRQDKIFVTKNGVSFEDYKKNNKPLLADRSIFLGRIEYRKRQHLVSNLPLNIDFAGFGDNLELNSANNFLGIWNKNDVYEKLTEYCNLILLSLSEAHALVCMEALSSGLGLVLSENCTANLDITKKFITIIPENKIKDFSYLKEKIEENREYSSNNRDEILEYARQFDWSIVSRNYLGTVQNILDKL